MSLNLDKRQRAMLHEMGVHVWLPVVPEAMDAGAQAAIDIIADSAEYARATSQNSFNNKETVPVISQPAAVKFESTPPPPARVKTPIRPVAAAVPGPTAVTALTQGIVDMTWSAMAQAVAQCQACAMCLGRRAAVVVVPKTHMPCDWLVVGDPPDEAEERAGQPFVDASGKLLDNMLRAVGVKRLDFDETVSEPAGASSGRAYLTHVLKCRPALARAPSADELATCAHYLRREIALTQPKVILAMGRFAMQVLLSETPPESARLPLGKLRGQVWRFAGTPVVVTYPPAYLLRSGQDKGKAWADLCLALDVARGELPEEN